MLYSKCKVSTARNTGILHLILLLPLLTISGCSFGDILGNNLADAVDDYCENNPPAGRQIVREGLKQPFADEDVAACLRCGGETITYCVGDTKTIELPTVIN